MDQRGGVIENVMLKLVHIQAFIVANCSLT